jgi:hypothetical protein
MAYSPEAAKAIVGLASRMGVDPGSLAGLFELESGGDPNIWGGAGGQYRGLIQFGPGARKEVGLPSGAMTVEQQIPFVERYFQQRGFTPGKHDVTAMYRTVLVGNPGQSGTDSFGTNSDSAAKRMMPGGDLYQRGAAKLQKGVGGAAIGMPGRSGATQGLEGLPRIGVALDSPADSEPAFDPVTSTALALVGGDEERKPRTTSSGQRLAAESPLAVAIAQLSPQTPQETKQIVQAVGALPSGESSGSGVFKVLEYLTGDDTHSGYRADHGGSNYHEHLAFASPDEARAAAALLNQSGIKTTELKGVNEVGGHSPNSYHYSGQAFDVPAAQVPVGQERELSRRVRALLRMG